jgi:hypothetical protein
MKYILGIVSSIIALISVYFKGKSVANKKNYLDKIEEKNIILETKIKEHNENKKIIYDIEKSITGKSATDIVKQLRKAKKDSTKSGK